MNEIENLITSIGALAEALGVFRDTLTKNGFSREEALFLCAKFLDTMHRNNSNDDD